MPVPAAGQELYSAFIPRRQATAGAGMNDFFILLQERNKKL